MIEARGGTNSGGPEKTLAPTRPKDTGETGPRLIRLGLRQRIGYPLAVDGLRAIFTKRYHDQVKVSAKDVVGADRGSLPDKRWMKEYPTPAASDISPPLALAPRRNSPKGVKAPMAANENR